MIATLHNILHLSDVIAFTV